MQLRLESDLREEPYQVNVRCVPICYGRECIYKSRLEMAAEGRNRWLTHHALAQTFSLGAFWVCKTRNSPKHFTECGVVTYCSDACQGADRRSHKAMCKPREDPAKRLVRQYMERLSRTVERVFGVPGIVSSGSESSESDSDEWITSSEEDQEEDEVVSGSDAGSS